MVAYEATIYTSKMKVLFPDECSHLFHNLLGIFEEFLSGLGWIAVFLVLVDKYRYSGAVESHISFVGSYEARYLTGIDLGVWIDLELYGSVSTFDFRNVE